MCDGDTCWDACWQYVLRCLCHCVDHRRVFQLSSVTVCVLAVRVEMPVSLCRPSSGVSTVISNCVCVLAVRVEMPVSLCRPSSGVSTVISNYAAAAQIGAAPGAGSGITQITEEERRRILEEEQRQLDQMKVSLFLMAWFSTELNCHYALFVKVLAAVWYCNMWSLVLCYLPDCCLVVFDCSVVTC